MNSIQQNLSTHSFKVVIVIFTFFVLVLNAAPYRIMPLGDSITEGHFSIADNNDVNTSTYTSGLIQANDQIAYRGNLWTLLVNEGYIFDEINGDIDFVGTRSKGSNYHSNFDTDHQGWSGITSYGIKNSISGWLDQVSVDMVLFHIGTNDPGQSIPIGSYDDINQSANTSINNIKETLDIIFTKNPNTKVLIAKIIKNSRAESFAAWTTIDFNNKIEEMVNNHSYSENIYIVDMHNAAGLVYTPAGVDMLPLHIEENNAPDYHPDEDGFTKIAQKWFDEILASGWLPNPEANATETYGPELIYSSGNENGGVSTQGWVPFGTNSLILIRWYAGVQYVYAVARSNDAGVYQSFSTELGKVYEVKSTFLGADSGMNEQFIQNSYITISDNIPTVDKSNLVFESVSVTGSVETDVTFRFTAESATSYLSLRSNSAWFYANAREISVKEVLDNSGGGVDTEIPQITLSGANPQHLNVGDSYVELGATATDNVDSNLNVSIDASTVNTFVEGNYTVTYDVNDSAGNQAVQVIRTVEVLAVTVPDTQIPQITLSGANPQHLNVGDSYVELGATATDNVDSNLNVSIDASTVNTSVEGNYTVTYDVNDSAGNQAVQVIRTVEVLGEVTTETYGPELIQGGGNELGVINKYLWSFFGDTYGQHDRTYNGELFIYASSKDLGSGMHQAISTEIGEEYEVTAILIGTDTNRLEIFNGESYITISSAFPIQSKVSVIAESARITGGIETNISFRFVASSTTSYLALRSDAPWHYASARAISVKKFLGSN